MTISWKGKEAKVPVEYQDTKQTQRTEKDEEENSEEEDSEEEEEIEDGSEEEEYEEAELENRLFYTALFDPGPILTNEGVYIKRKYYQWNHFTELDQKFKQEPIQLKYNWKGPNAKGSINF